MLKTKSVRRNTDWKGSSRSWKKSNRRMNFCSRSKIESMQECVETGVVFCQPIVQRPHVARDLFGDRRTRKESVIRTTATKCSNRCRSSNSWVKMWMQHCLLLGLLKGAGSRAFPPAHRQVYTRWRRMPPTQIGQHWTLHQWFGPDVDREQDQDPLQKQTHWQAGKAWDEKKEWRKCQSSTSRAPQVAKPCQKIEGCSKSQG